jgi:polygalacturonase
MTTRRDFLTAALLTVAVARFVAAQDTGAFDVREFGAIGDGQSLDAAAINSVIDAAAAAGGGRVHLPAGSYLSHSIRRKSNVSLYLSEGSTLVAVKLPPRAGRGRRTSATSSLPYRFRQV